MRIRYGSALAALVLAAGLTACGGGSSEFKSKMSEMCTKDGGKIEGLGQVDCSCAVDIMDAKLDGDTKAFLLKMLKVKEAVEKDPAKAADAMKEAGIDPTNADSMKKMEEMGKKAEGVDAEIREKCAKKS